MATLGSLIISLEANTARFEAGMSKAQYQAKQSSDAIKKAFTEIGVAMAAAFSVSKLESMFMATATMESNLTKMAGRLSTNVETLSSFGVMARKTGMDIDAFYTTLTRMDKGMSAAAMNAETATGKYDEEGEEILKTAKAYDELGLKAGELVKLPWDQRLMAIAAAMKANIDPADRVRIAMEMGGKSAAGMVNIFKEGEEGVRKWITAQRELGVITDEMAAKGAAAKSATGDLTAAWEHFKDVLMTEVSPAITHVLNQLLQGIRDANRFEQQAAEMGAKFGAEAEKRFRDISNARRAAGGVGPFGEAVEPSWPVPIQQTKPELFKPPVRPSEVSKGAKGGGAAEGRMQSIIDTLQKDLSRLTEGSLAEIEAWAAKMINEIEKVGKKGAETEEALRLVAEVESAKKKKATEDYENFVAKESGDAYKQIEADARGWLEKYKGFAGAEENIAAIKARKIWEEDVKNYEQRLSMQKTALEGLAQEAPLLSEQITWKEKLLPLEIESNRLAQEKLIYEMQLKGVITEAQAAELRGAQALQAQYKKYNLERQKWETQGIGGGLKGWAYEKQEEGQTSLSKQTKGAMKSLESGISSTISKGIIGGLKGEKTDFEQMGWDLADAFISKTVELGISQLFTMIAQAVLPMTMAGTTTAIELETAGITVSTEIITGAQVAGAELIAAATEAAAIMAASSSFGFGIFHSGGVIKAHGGLNLASDEVPIIAQTGERVLSRNQNRIFEAGLQMGGGNGGGHTFNISYAPNYDRRPSGYERRRDIREMNKALASEMGRRN